MGPVSCGSFGVTPVMIGLHRIGVVGLDKALQQVDQAGLEGREAELARLMEILAADNYIPESQREAFRTAIRRELLRHRGEDFSDFFSPAEVIVRGDPGEERDRFVAMLESVFADFELRPVVTFAPAPRDGPGPELAIGDHAIVSGAVSRDRFKRAVRTSLSDW
jgi:hypothetical protein